MALKWSLADGCSDGRIISHFHFIFNDLAMNGLPREAKGNGTTWERVEDLSYDRTPLHDLVVGKGECNGFTCDYNTSNTDLDRINTKGT